MKRWLFVVIPAGLVLAGAVYLLVNGPGSAAPERVGWALPRLRVDRVVAPLPPRFTGPLPSQVEDFHEALEKGPPLSHVRARLLEGDREMGARFLTTLRQGAASAWNLDELWVTYGPALGIGDHMRERGNEAPEEMRFWDPFQDDGVPCAWLTERLSDTAEESPLLTELLWRKLVRCQGPEAAALFAREDAPTRWVLDHCFHSDSPRCTPAIERAARRILEQGQRELFHDAFRQLRGHEEPEARELSAALWRQLSDRERAEQEEMDASLASMRRQQQVHPRRCPPVPTRPEGVAELTVQECVEEWAATHWAATARFAMSASRSPELQPGHSGSEPLAAVRNFPSAAALKVWARERQLIPDVPPAPEKEPDSLYLSTLMLQARRAFHVDLRTVSYPREHDDLLVTLAWKARSELAGVVFEQLPPKVPEPILFEPRPSEGYTLRAYADGQRFSVQARNSPSLMDIGAALGLLNQVLEARGSPRRFAVLDSQVTEVFVMFAPEAPLREADERGLLRLGDGSEVFEKAEASVERGVRSILGEAPF